MAKVVIWHRVKNFDSSLVNFLGNTIWMPGSTTQTAQPGYRFFEPGAKGGYFLFTLKLGGKLAAAVRDGDPFKIVVFDETALIKIKEILRQFESEETVLIEVE